MPVPATGCTPPPLTPILWLSVGFLVGQWLAPWTSGWSFSAAAFSAAIASLLLSRRSETALVAAAAAAAAGLGHLQLDARLAPQHAPHHVARLQIDSAQLRGTITDNPILRPAGLRFVLAVDAVHRSGEWQRACGRLLVTARGTHRLWRRGDRVSMRLRLRAPRNFGNPGEFDYEHFLARRGIYTTGFAFSDAPWMRLQRRSPTSWRDSVAQHARAALAEIAPPRVRSIAAALLLGEGAAIPQDLRRVYARAGVAHVLAISGLHIGLIAAAVNALFRWLLGRSERLLLAGLVPKLATAASLPPLLAYAAIAGATAATLRATVMIVLFLSALLLGRPRFWPAGIAAAAAVICIWVPGALFEASFQLSFAAVIGIVAGGSRLRDAFDRWAERRLLRLHSPRRHSIERWLVLSQGISALALLATAPLTLFHFQQLSLVGLVSNAVIVPIIGMGGVSTGLLGMLVTPFFPGVGGILLAAFSAILWIGDSLTALFAALPLSDIKLPTPSLAEIATYYGLLALPLIRRQRPRRALAVVLLIIGSLQWAYWHNQRFASGDMVVTFLSVGQGDSTLFELPGGHVILVDGGGLSATFDVGERVLAPLLRRRKIQKVDTVVLTHPDFDHYGGLGYIVENFGVDEVWSNGSHARGVRYDDFAKRVAAAGATRRVLHRGDRRQIGETLIRVLHPGDGDVDDSNDASLTLHVSHGGVGVLMTGDIERDGEQALLRREGDLRSAILKVPHHGSRTSSSPAFIDTVRPLLAVTSCGFDNRYGMPHSSIIQSFDRRRITHLRTDLDGAIEVRVAPTGALQITRGRRWRSSRRSADHPCSPSLGVGLALDSS